MNIFITGVSGFIGTNLAHAMLESGYNVIGVGTSPSHKTISHEQFHYISADTTQRGDWQHALQNVDAVINLAGRNIFRRWNQHYKSQIYASRMLTTRNLVEVIPKDRNIPLVSTSGAGYYGDRSDDVLNEEELPGDDFLSQVCVDWEKEAFEATKKGTRVVIIRLGVVLGKDGGALKKMLPAFKCFVGGPLGNGAQYFPWIHMDDLVSAVLYILEKQNIIGPLNFTAPNTIRQRDFAKALGHAIKRPAFFRVPEFVIRGVIGEMGTLLLNSQRAVPERLTKYGFEFQYPDIHAALDNIITASENK